jgi:CubicO group peptidase (beta-lactamase class C family)
MLVCERLATRIPGVQVAVAVNGKLVWSEGFGYADAARMRPVTHQTQFRIGSVSKRSTGRRYPIARDSRLKPRLGTYR